MLTLPIFPSTEPNISNMKFYHGTSDALDISVLKSPDKTGILRDENNDFKDKVFITNCLTVAKNYARKAADVFGGRPVVYLVKPEGDVWNMRDYEFVADEAQIIQVWWKGKLHKKHDR